MTPADLDVIRRRVRTMDPTPNERDLLALLAEVDGLRELLRRVQWAGYIPYIDGDPACPVCNNPPYIGHADGCALKAAVP
jgi:hypothetical protein